MREICETLGFNRSSFYYHPQEDPSEALLRSEIEKLAGAYQTATPVPGIHRWNPTRCSVDEGEESLGLRQACLSNN